MLFKASSLPYMCCILLVPKLILNIFDMNEGMWCDESEVILKVKSVRIVITLGVIVRISKRRTCA